MTDEQQEHLLRVLAESKRLISRKYRKGVAEHGGFLMDSSTEELLDNAIDEAVDQLVYLLSLKEKLEGDKCQQVRTSEHNIIGKDSQNHIWGYGTEIEGVQKRFLRGKENPARGGIETTERH